jgi:hypothetical protein
LKTVRNLKTILTYHDIYVIFRRIFAAVILLKNGAVAQLGERLNGIQEARGSTPLSSTKDGKREKAKLKS